MSESLSASLTDVKRIFFSSSISYPPITILCDEDAESKTCPRMDGLSFCTTRLIITIRVLGQWMACISYTIVDRDIVETFWSLLWQSFQFSLNRSPYLIRGRSDPHSLMTVFFSRVTLRIHDSLLHAERNTFENHLISGSGKTWIPLINVIRSDTRYRWTTYGK